MKKTYQQPSMSVVKVQPQQMIAESLGVSEQNANPNGGMLSRGRGRFTDDDEE